MRPVITKPTSKHPLSRCTSPHTPQTEEHARKCTRQHTHERSSNVMFSPQAAELLSACREAGCNFFDNAEVYAKGDAEILIGKAIKVGSGGSARLWVSRGLWHAQVDSGLSTHRTRLSHASLAAGPALPPVLPPPFPASLHPGFWASPACHATTTHPCTLAGFGALPPPLRFHPHPRPCEAVFRRFPCNASLCEATPACVFLSPAVLFPPTGAGLETLGCCFVNVRPYGC